MSDRSLVPLSSEAHWSVGIDPIGRLGYIARPGLSTVINPTNPTMDNTNLITDETLAPEIEDDMSYINPSQNNNNNNTNSDDDDVEISLLDEDDPNIHAVYSEYTAVSLSVFNQRHLVYPHGHPYHDSLDVFRAKHIDKPKRFAPDHRSLDAKFTHVHVWSHDYSDSNIGNFGAAGFTLPAPFRCKLGIVIFQEKKTLWEYINNETCSVCGDKLEPFSGSTVFSHYSKFGNFGGDSASTPHFFCGGCMLSIINDSGTKCPVCRQVHGFYRLGAGFSPNRETYTTVLREFHIDCILMVHQASKIYYIQKLAGAMEKEMAARLEGCFELLKDAVDRLNTVRADENDATRKLRDATETIKSLREELDRARTPAILRRAPRMRVAPEKRRRDEIIDDDSSSDFENNNNNNN